MYKYVSNCIYQKHEQLIFIRTKSKINNKHVSVYDFFFNHKTNLQIKVTLQTYFDTKIFAATGTEKNE